MRKPNAIAMLRLVGYRRWLVMVMIYGGKKGWTDVSSWTSSICVVDSRQRNGVAGVNGVHGIVERFSKVWEGESSSSGALGGYRGYMIYGIATMCVKRPTGR